MRKLQPCGTRAAYARHLYKKEDPCAKCKAANVSRVQAAPSGGGNSYEREMDRALAANPPVIVWRKTRAGIRVAVSVDDPHAETRTERSRDREWGQRIAREEAALAAMQVEARRVAERIERHRAENTPLMAAARTSI